MKIKKKKLLNLHLNRLLKRGTPYKVIKKLIKILKNKKLMNKIDRKIN